jgi:hypothetical protein
MFKVLFAIASAESAALQSGCAFCIQLVPFYADELRFRVEEEPCQEPQSPERQLWVERTRRSRSGLEERRGLVVIGMRDSLVGIPVAYSSAR